MVITMCSVTTGGNAPGGGSCGSKAMGGGQCNYVTSGMWTSLRPFIALEARARRYHPLILTLHPKYSIGTQLKLNTRTQFSKYFLNARST